MSAVFQYAINADGLFPNKRVDVPRFTQEIRDSDLILIALDSVAIAGDNCVIVFKDDLPLDQLLALEALIFAHTGDPIPAALPKLTDDGVAYTVQQPQTVSYEMCDRDLKIITCKVEQATAVEDLKLNPITLKEENWLGPELSLIGVYKNDGDNMALCSDQADADANGVLSVFEYKAFNQTDGTTQIPYNIRSGALVRDPAIQASERFDHRAYVIAVPGLGSNYFVRLFDGYLAAHPDGLLDVESPQAKLLNPSIYPGVSNAVRIYIKHPQGQSNSHVLWLLTYRPAGSF